MVCCFSGGTPPRPVPPPPNSRATTDTRTQPKPTLLSSSELWREKARSRARCSNAAAPSASGPGPSSDGRPRRDDALLVTRIGAAAPLDGGAGDVPNGEGVGDAHDAGVASAPSFPASTDAGVSGPEQA